VCFVHVLLFRILCETFRVFVRRFMHRKCAVVVAWHLVESLAASMAASVVALVTTCAGYLYASGRPLGTQDAAWLLRTGLHDSTAVAEYSDRASQS
jgi:hypothetical protein